jgi:transmembrane sensor
MNQEKYNTFGVTDFVSDDLFLKHYLSPTNATTQFWSDWLAHNPNKQTTWDEAKLLIEAVVLGLNDYVRTYLSEESQNRLLERIQATNRANTTYSLPILTKWRWTAAACLLLMLGFWYYRQAQQPTLSIYQQQVMVLNQKTIERNNTTQKPQSILLSDGSTIILSPKSRVTYPSSFSKDARTIYLSGEAEFEVAKDSQRPFYVYANEIITKVLGTRFVVNAFDKDKHITVKVKEGQVSVYQPHKKLGDMSNTKGVLLLPNQQVIFERQTEQFSKTLIPDPVIMGVAVADVISFEFNETPVVTALEQIEKAYGIDLVFDRDALKNCQITTSLDNLSLFQKIDIITQIIGGSYETVDGQIVITAKGCRE